MIELVLVACLHAAPERCEERSIGLYTDVSLMTCMLSGQPHIAAWAETHPHLSVSRWSCRNPAARETRA